MEKRLFKMNRFLIVVFYFLVMLTVPGTGFTEPVQDKTVNLPKIILKPQIKTLAPVIDGDSRYTAVAALLGGQFSQSSWILDEPVVARNRIVKIFAKDMAEMGARIVIHTQEKWHKGERLTIHRLGEILHNSEGQTIGRLSETVGVAELVEFRDGEWMATIVKIFKEILVGDLADMFYNETLSIKFKDDPDLLVSGSVVSVDKNLDMAGKGQVVVVGLGMKDRVYPGLILPVHRNTPEVSDVFRSMFSQPEPERQDRMPIAEVVLFRVAGKASLALVVQSTEPVVKGDRVGTPRVSSPVGHEAR